MFVITRRRLTADGYCLGTHMRVGPSDD